MQQISIKQSWLAIALGSAGLAGASIIITPWLDLHPCHLCIFQRLLYTLLALTALASALTLTKPRWQPLFTGLTLLLALTGLATASYQSWLQAQPKPPLSCGMGEQTLLEVFVDWLGQQLPSLFLATGYCEDKELVILTLSLANWSLVAFTLVLLVAGISLYRQRAVENK
ncbi:MAG: disulfide bond formation protein B [Gammaproteobacteria bacterium]|nr:disulfide bond formation protein B [Gammaproteobacteria bacterium]